MMNNLQVYLCATHYNYGANIFNIKCDNHISSVQETAVPGSAVRAGEVAPLPGIQVIPMCCLGKNGLDPKIFSWDIYLSI